MSLENVIKNDKKPSKVQINSNLEDEPSTSNLTDEIHKVEEEIEEILNSLPSTDPNYKKHAKKLNEIKKFLAKKSKESMKLAKKKSRQKGNQKLINVINEVLEQDTMSASPSEIIELITNPPRSNFVNYNVDDSLLYGAEYLLFIWDFCKAQFK
jgi:hypothetical protein